MSQRICQCRTPKPRPAGVGKVVCVGCHGRVLAKKKAETGGAERDTLRDDIRRIEREIRSLTAQVQELKQRVSEPSAER